MGLADGLELGQRQRGRGKAARTAHLGVEGRVRGQPDVAHALVTLARFGRQGMGRCLGDGAQRVRQPAHDACHLLQLVGDGAAQHLAEAQLGLPWASGRLDINRARLGRHVEHGVCQCDCGLTVHRRVMQLGVDSDKALSLLAAHQALDDVESKQGPRAVEQLHVQRAHQRLQCLAAGVGRQPVQHHVVRHVGFGVHPGRVGQVQGHAPDASPQHGHDRQASPQMLAQMRRKGSAKAIGQRIDIEGAHMHGHLGRLELEEQGVQTGQLLHALNSMRRGSNWPAKLIAGHRTRFATGSSGKRPRRVNGGEHYPAEMRRRFRATGRMGRSRALLCKQAGCTIDRPQPAVRQRLQLAVSGCKRTTAVCLVAANGRSRASRLAPAVPEVDPLRNSLGIVGQPQSGRSSVRLTLELSGSHRRLVLALEEIVNR